MTNRLLFLLLSLLAAVSTARADEAPLVTEVARFDANQVTGVAVSKSGRVFVCFPYWHDGHTVSVAELHAGGDATAYPNEHMNEYREATGMEYADRFLCVQSLTVDDKDRLWILDSGAPRMKAVRKDGPKLVCIDLTQNIVTKLWHLDFDLAPDRSYLNDLRIDTARNTAFITDSGLGAIVVVDLATGEGRRRLADYPVTKAIDVVVPVIDGKELRHADGAAPKIHADGIALDPARGYLYWQALTSRRLYRVKTDLLADPTVTNTALSRSVEDLGETVMTDGMEIDADGNLYFTAIEQNAIVVRAPDGTLRTLVKSPLLSWPDSLAFGPGRSLYITTSSIQKSEWFAPDEKDRGPFRVFRLSLPPTK